MQKPAVRSCPYSRAALVVIVLMGGAFPVSAQITPPPGEEPALSPPRITQAMITSGAVSLHQIRAHGLRVFAAPFNKLDGYGDGPMKPGNPIAPGGRPTLQRNGTFLRVNGLDSQTCMECHSVLSTATVPFRFGIAGVGGANNNAMFMPTFIDVADQQGNGFAATDGRFINPPFLLGAGGVELVGKEMTMELQRLARTAQQQPGSRVQLVTKGVDFGVIVFANGRFDTSGVVGIEPDLVVRPFGRKGEFSTTRAFDLGALQFHLGMQPVEVVGAGIDDDGDGVVDEILIGEVSALAIFNTTLELPVQSATSPQARRGAQVFRTIGCVMCHIPELTTGTPTLTHSFPEVETDPSANVFYAVNLLASPPRFARSAQGGIRVPMFSDLKRYDMGPGLAESTGGPLDPLFITARLWGVADTAPYLHDGRALTLTDAILLHGGDAGASSAGFGGLADTDKRALLAYLRTLLLLERAGGRGTLAGRRRGRGAGRRAEHPGRKRRCCASQASEPLRERVPAASMAGWNRWHVLCALRGVIGQRCLRARRLARCPMDDDHFLLTGRKLWITNAAEAGDLPGDGECAARRRAIKAASPASWSSAAWTASRSARRRTSSASAPAPPAS